MKHIPHHTMTLILACAVTAVVVGLYGYMQVTVKASLTHALEARASVVEGEALQRGERKTVDTYQMTAEDRAALREHFVPADNAVRFIEAIEALGPATHGTVTISSIAPETGTPPSGIASFIRAHVEASGSWEAMMRLLVLAENLSYVSSLDAVTLTTSVAGSKPSTREWSLSFDLRAPTVAAPL